MRFGTHFGSVFFRWPGLKVWSGFSVPQSMCLIVSMQLGFKLKQQMLLAALFGFFSLANSPAVIVCLNDSDGFFTSAHR
jgi:hypothetical protein